jgi:hypothetical protein
MFTNRARAELPAHVHRRAEVVIALEWWYSNSQQEGHVTRTSAEVDAMLDTLAGIAREDWPALAEVTRAEVTDFDAPALHVGLHVGRGVLLYTGPDDENGSFSRGDGPADGEPILYMQGTSADEFPPDSEIPVEIVRRAVHEFAETYRRPSDVPWQPFRGGRLL